MTFNFPFNLQWAKEIPRVAGVKISAGLEENGCFHVVQHSYRVKVLGVNAG